MSLPPEDVLPTISTGAPPSHYQAYLNSPSWRLRRNRALQDASWRCQRCPAKRNLHVRHKSYERLGAEWDTDLEVLCENCHREEHIANPEQTTLGVYLKLASSLIHEHPYLSVADLADDIKRRCIALKIPVNIQRINGAIAVICGNRLASPKQVEPERKYAHVPESDRPISHHEARETIALLGIHEVMETIVKTMPSHQARDPRTHSQILAAQVAAFRGEERRSVAPNTRVPILERLESIFAEKWS